MLFKDKEILLFSGKFVKNQENQQFDLTPDLPTF
jgi:hypothetical protein